MMEKASSDTSWKMGFNLVKDYFVNSDEQLKAWSLLIGSTLCVIALVALMAAFAWWSAGFWEILIAKEMAPFLISMGQFGALLGAFVGITVLKNFLVGTLSILWRNWLTKKITNDLFEGDNNYLDLKRSSLDIDNIEQRIQEDVKNLVDLTLNLGTDLLRSVLSLGTFIGALWVVGGSLSFTAWGLNIVIPGYLVWVALIISVAATVMTHVIGKALPQDHKQAERSEADFRQEIAVLNDNAENIAEEHAEHYYQTSLENKIQDLKNSTSKKLDTQTKLIAFQSFYSQLTWILPNILSAPLYFTGLIELGQLMQIEMAFTEVSMSLSWLSNSYEQLSTYKASIDRIAELQKILEKNNLDANSKAIVSEKRNGNSLNIEHLNIKKPSSTKYMMRNLNLKLDEGDRVLIKGSSGIGKSTLFKVISGTWKYGEGKVVVPANKRFYFLPQKPTIPYGSLKSVLSYPEPAENYTESQYSSVLEEVGKMTDFIPRLDEITHWSNELSGGQQQRIAFARALLKKPDWLFLDESTSQLDEKSEKRVYQLITQKLNTTTIVSIGHRSTIEKHHSKVVYFKVNKDREIKVDEYPGLGARAGII